MNVKVTSTFQATIQAILIALIMIFIFPFAVLSQPDGGKRHYGVPVLKGVSGFGLESVGGRGGEIIKVTNLKRDGIDQRIIAGVQNGTGRIINSEKEGGGYPAYQPVHRKFNPEEWDLGLLEKRSIDR